MLGDRLPANLESVAQARDRAGDGDHVAGSLDVAKWWERFQQVGGDERNAMVVTDDQPKKKRRRRRGKKHAEGGVAPEAERDGDE